MFNNIFYNLVYLLYRFLTVLVHPFQRKFINLYTVELQLNRLPFRVIPNAIKSLLIYFVDVDSWILFFKRIKNHNNLYILREKQKPRLYRLWCIFFRNKAVYYSELNIKRSHSRYISNFFYKTRIWQKSAKKLSNRYYNVILFYYINKLALTNYPYLYWTYVFAYNRYKYNIDASNQSHHVRTYILYILINESDKFNKNLKLKSFIKFDFYTFKGIKKSIQNLDKIWSYKHVLKKHLIKDKILTKIEDQSKLLDKNFIKLYYNLNSFTKILNYKFYIHEIINRNVLKFNGITNIILLNSSGAFKLKWYNKVHNSTFFYAKNNIVLFLRAAKHFNKGRYSRNRQLYRTGVYWCIWLNIVIVYSLHFYFYRFVYSFGYLWLPLSLLLLSIFSSRLYKYRYYSLKQLILEFKEFNNFSLQLFVKLKYLYLMVVKIKIAKFVNFLKNYAVLVYIYIFLRARSIINFFKKIFLI